MALFIDANGLVVSGDARMLRFNSPAMGIGLPFGGNLIGRWIDFLESDKSHDQTAIFSFVKDADSGEIRLSGNGIDVYLRLSTDGIPKFCAFLKEIK